MTETAIEVMTDTILDGRLRLRQPARGHRAGTDAVLLAAAAATKAKDVLVDVGAGVGSVGLALALRETSLTGVLLDADPTIAALAEENCRLNGLEGRLRAAVADLFDPGARKIAGVVPGAASLVVSNPPFMAGGDHRPSPNPGKARAHTLRHHGHAGWLEAAAALLAPGGRFHMIHRPEALPALLQACGGRLGALRILPVFGKAGAPAIRIILSGVKGSRAPLRLLPGLVMHEPDGRFTAAAEAIHRGDLLITM